MKMLDEPNTDEVSLQRDEKRAIIFGRDGHECQHCGGDVSLRQTKEEPVGHLHHIIPERKGGRDIPNNLVTLCGECHMNQHGNWDYEFGNPIGFSWEHRSVLITPDSESIIDWFDGQRCCCASVSRISAETGLPKESVQAILKQLNLAGFAELMHEPTDEYYLIEDPRDES